MRRTFIGFLLVGLLMGLPVRAELKMDSGPGSGKGGSGTTEVAEGNSKGQTVALAKDASLTGIVLQVVNVSAAGDLKLEICKTKGGFPNDNSLLKLLYLGI